MTSDTAVNLHNDVKDLLEHSSLHKAFRTLASALEKHSDPKLADLLKKQEEIYKYMIHYLVEGYSDSSRSTMLADIVSSLHFINDSILRNTTLTDSPDVYSSTLRFERIRKASLASRISAYRDASSMALLANETGGNNEIRKSADEALLGLFSYVWTMYGASADDYNLLREAVISNNLPFDFRAQVISALMLGNITYFDGKALDLLLDIFDADIDARTNARALVAIVFIIAANPDRVKNDPRLKARLSLWADSIIIYRQLREVVMNIIRAHDTQRISDKMQNEILPELMKMRPEIMEKLQKLGKTSEITDFEPLDINPEWEEILNKSSLGDQLKELTDMQMEGGDVMMVAFSNLKSFPFFNTVANWFLPFGTDHIDMFEASSETLGLLSEIFNMDGIVCDSDKYSFVFSFAKMPESQQKIVLSQINEQASQLKEVMAERKLKSTVPEFDAEVTRYIRNLYRFFKLFRRKEDFNDPFAKPLDFSSLPYIHDVLSDTEILNLVGEFYFKRGYYAEALPLLLKLEKDNSDDARLWEKIGYCYNATGELEKAMTWYKKAELIHPDSKWLMKKMALCSRLTGNYKEAAEYYTKALATDPDNYSLLMNLGHCLIELEEYDKALHEYYHAEYIRPEKISTWRAIAWTELINNNFEKSLEYYKKLLSHNECSPTDHLNAGHIYYLTGDLKNAVANYKRSALYEGFSMDKLEKAILEDIPAIEKVGGKPEELYLLLDKVKYEI